MKRNILSISLALVVAASTFSFVTAATTTTKPATKKVALSSKVKPVSKSAVKSKTKPKSAVKHASNFIGINSGTLSGVITYSTNKTSDYGACIYLVNKSAKIEDINKNWFMIPDPNGTYKIKAYVSSIKNQKGNYTFKSIPAGIYVMFVVSAKTTNKKQTLPQKCPKSLKGLLDYSTFKSCFDPHSNMKIFSNVVIKENKITNLNYNFLDK